MIWNLIRSKSSLLFSVLFVLSLSTGVYGNVIKPQLDIQTLRGDGAISSLSGTLTMDATAIALITNGGPVDIPDVDFSLTAQFDSFIGSIAYVFDNGSLTVGSLLTADFTGLTLLDLGGGMGQFYADLTYTGGSLKGSLSNGRIEGMLSGANMTNFSLDFTATTIIAKVGPVVPIPGAIWLLGSGLIGIVGIRRKFRKT